jgi:elongation factor P
MIDVNKLKEGVTYLDGGHPYRVVKYNFSKMGRGKANIKVKVKSLLTGAVVVKSYLSGNSVEPVEIEKVKLQYLYSDGGILYLMDPTSFEQTEIDKEVIGDDIFYLVEGEKVWVQFWGEKVVGVELPPSVVLKVKETGPGEKGNSATNILKPATLESGLVVQVPTFIREGESLKINTQTGEYVSRMAT